jgi:23S rRNA (adenine2503-C2)-methyltransferase
LKALHAALVRFPLEPRRRLTIEWVMIDGVNDAPGEARRLVAWVRGLRIKVNLIPLNEDPVHLPGLRASSEPAIERFCAILADAGLTVTVRRSRGATALAACGQLKGRDRSSRELRRTKRGEGAVSIAR